MRLAVLATIAVTILLATAGDAAASCVEQSDAEQRARAEVIVEGVILPGAEPSRTRLRVSRYLKGDGPRELAIGGGNRAGVVSSVDIDPAAGERWRILGDLREAGTVVTTVCDGSARVDARGPFAPAGGGTPAWFAGVALALLTAGLFGA